MRLWVKFPAPQNRQQVLKHTFYFRESGDFLNNLPVLVTNQMIREGKTSGLGAVLCGELLCLVGILTLG